MSKPITLRLFGKRSALIAGAVALGLGLSACSGGNGSPGVAAYVNGTEVSENQVTDSIKDWALLTGEEVSRADMAMSIAQAEVVLPISLEAGLVDDAQVDEVILGFAEASGSDKVPDLTPTTRDLLAYFVSIQNLQMVNDQSVFEAVLAEMETAQLRLNPRYGTIENSTYLPPSPLADGFSNASETDIAG